jgi:hypothetical protein
VQVEPTISFGLLPGSRVVIARERTVSLNFADPHEEHLREARREQPSIRRSPRPGTGPLLEDAKRLTLPRWPTWRGHLLPVPPARRAPQATGQHAVGCGQQMLALPRAFGTDPKLVALDELSMGLALIVVRQPYELVTELATQGSRSWSSNRSPEPSCPLPTRWLRHALRPDRAGEVRRPISKTTSCPATWVPERLRPPGLRVRLRVPRRPRARTPSPRRTGDSLRHGAGPDW